MVEAPHLLLAADIEQFLAELIQVPVLVHVPVHLGPSRFDALVPFPVFRDVPVEHGVIDGETTAMHFANGHVIDAFPFVNSLVVCKLTGAQLKEVLEQGFTLERGMVQASGLKAVYDLSRPRGSRLVSLEIGGRPVDEKKIYSVATNSFLAQGGDLYETFLKTEQEDSGILLSDLLMNYLKEKGSAELPTPGRLMPVKP